MEVNNTKIDRELLGLNNGVEAAKVNDNDSLSQEDFFELIIAQMRHQNPLEPQEGTEMVSQLAQLSTVDGISGTNKKLDEVVDTFRYNQAFQASLMVGRSVLINTDQLHFDGENSTAGIIKVDETTQDLQLIIQNEAGENVNKIELGIQSAGEFVFAWDGTNEQGEKVEPGTYTVKAQGLVGEDRVSFDTEIEANVNSVTLGNGSEFSLNLSNYGSIPFSQVRRIN